MTTTDNQAVTDKSILGVIAGLLSWLWSLDTRAVEILLAMEAFRRGVVWLLPGQSLDSEVYDSLAIIGGATFWGCLFVVAGGLQALAVIVNGNWRRSPVLRFLCLLITMTVYIVIMIVFFQNQGTPAVQAATSQLLFVVVSAWVAVNISAKAR